MSQSFLNIVRTWKILLAELVVVFVGVYGAFWVDNYRDELDRKDRTAEVVAVLVQDLTDLIDVSGSFNEYMQDGLQKWDEARQHGEKEPPYVFRIFGAEKPPLTTWQVVSQAQLAELLEPNLLYELGFYYNELSGLGDRYVRYAEFTESDVLPLMKTGSAGFYDEDGKELLPRFEANMDRLREYHKMSVEIVDWAKCLRDRVASVDSSNVVCRSVQGVTPM
ncbi:MAG: hypothetical protein O3A13_04405 [Proteobacteria bacterium]|nr:hypothetical protein [Pseudomonadota bacterium]